MKRTIRKKFALYVVLVFFMGAPFTFAQSDNNTDFVGLDTSNSLKNIPKIIDFIDNDKGIVVLSDMDYRLKLNTKVYDQGKKVTNRYALKKGQRVSVKFSENRSKRYIDTIFILGK
ncbi:MAG: hypothetical protein ACI80S_001628 [Pseudohongiellaceae bacterium]|jgi:hypothetical protein